MINKKIKDICKKNNMTLKELGERIGKSKQYMSELSNGNIRLRYEIAIDIAKVFGTTPDKIFLTNKSTNNVQKDTALTNYSTN